MAHISGVVAWEESGSWPCIAVFLRPASFMVLVDSDCLPGGQPAQAGLVRSDRRSRPVSTAGLAEVQESLEFQIASERVQGRDLNERAVQLERGPVTD